LCDHLASVPRFLHWVWYSFDNYNSCTVFKVSCNIFRIRSTNAREEKKGEGANKNLIDDEELNMFPYQSFRSGSPTILPATNIYLEIRILEEMPVLSSKIHRSISLPS
jgi:hypothetical protein